MFNNVCVISIFLISACAGQEDQINTAEPSELVTEIAWSYDYDLNCVEPELVGFDPVQPTADMWSTLGVTITPESEAPAEWHHVSICYTFAIVNGEMSSDRHLLGAAKRSEGSSQIYVVPTLQLADTVHVLAHEFAHIVTDSGDHSPSPGVFFRQFDPGWSNGYWSEGDIEYFESLGL